MGIDLGALLLDPIYASPQGIPARLEVNTAGVDLTVVDSSQSLDAFGNPVGIGTIRTAVDVRLSEIIANDLTRVDLSGVTVVLWPGQTGEETWRVESVHPRSGPLGEASGELRLYLDSDV